MAGSRRVEFQNDLTAEEYAALMNDNIKDLTELRLWSLERIKENKAKVACAYNKKVKLKEFQVRDLVWEAVLPLGTKDAAYEKWSPNWHGPYRIDHVLPGNVYMLEELDGVKFPVVVNGQHLKKNFPACGMTDIEQSIIRIRLYREGGRYMESANNKKRKNGKKNTKKGKRIQKKKEKKKRRRHMYNSR
jgi:hypothetical protein